MENLLACSNMLVCGEVGCGIMYMCMSDVRKSSGMPGGDAGAHGAGLWRGAWPGSGAAGGPVGERPGGLPGLPGGLRPGFIMHATSLGVYVLSSSRCGNLATKTHSVSMLFCFVILTLKAAAVFQADLNTGITMP